MKSTSTKTKELFKPIEKEITGVGTEFKTNCPKCGSNHTVNDPHSVHFRICVPCRMTFKKVPIKLK